MGKKRDTRKLCSTRTYLDTTDPGSFPADKVKEFGMKTPLGRAGQPAELAPAYVLLASREASFMSGATVQVTGGMPTI